MITIIVFIPALVHVYFCPLLPFEEVNELVFVGQERVSNIIMFLLSKVSVYHLDENCVDANQARVFELVLEVSDVGALALLLIQAHQGMLDVL